MKDGHCIRDFLFSDWKPGDLGPSGTRKDRRGIEVEKHGREASTPSGWWLTPGGKGREEMAGLG